MEKLKWETIVEQHDNIVTRRLKVFGGWIVKDYTGKDNISTVFVPDQNHEWEL